MDFKYQLIILGKDNAFEKLVVDTFYKRIQELGLATEAIIVIKQDDFNKLYKGNSPVVCLYFGGNKGKDIDILSRLIDDASIIVPIVEDKAFFTSNIPESLHPINGFQLGSELDVEPLVSCILEGFSLLRLSRRLFISYKRNESRGVAIQLFEKLEQAGFDVFLDTHSIRPGDEFQEELWHRLVDTDVVVLLNTPQFLESAWTTQELARANSMSIGIFQLTWPLNVLPRMAELCIPLQLKEDNFLNNDFNNVQSQLNEISINLIVNNVESLRARSLAARQDNIITEFIAACKIANKSAVLHREKFLTITDKNRQEIIIIPTVGVPHAFTYNQSEELIKVIRASEVKKIFLLYDHRNIREKWLQHLAWLDNYLPVNTIKITEADKWLKNN